MREDAGSIIRILIIFFWLILILTLICFSLSLIPGIFEIQLLSIILKLTAVSAIILLAITNILFLLFIFLLMKRFFTG